MSEISSLPRQRAVVLLVEDDPGDQELTRRALQEDVLRMDLRIVSDGAEALDYLLRRGQYQAPESSPRPELILLDLNMPKINGRQVLERMKGHPVLKHIPVVVLTTSNQEEDILRSYDLGCNSFVTKPVALEAFLSAVRELGHYWFELVALPSSTEIDGGVDAIVQGDSSDSIRSPREVTSQAN